MSAKRASESKRNSKKPPGRATSPKASTAKPAAAKAAGKKAKPAAAKEKPPAAPSAQTAAVAAVKSAKNNSKAATANNAGAKANSRPAYVVRWQVRDIDLVREHSAAHDARSAFETFEEARERAVDDLIDTLEHLERRLLELKRAASFEDYALGRAATPQ